ncbi:hypothetical protein DdX_15591 [Ditylenchus destructor]|uniref:Uncharacterized protein n=1 Tax=Ditylenchus destructor TaxID=166010 RepID=A0AAD4QUL5_9BILA|nr:hypothetical protein DdX_15591 [Ditylenchus destructor]
MDSTGTAQDATIVDPTRSSAAHDTVEQPMEEVEDDNVSDIAFNANRRASLNTDVALTAFRADNCQVEIIAQGKEELSGN